MRTENRWRARSLFKGLNSLRAVRSGPATNYFLLNLILIILHLRYLSLAANTCGTQSAALIRRVIDENLITSWAAHTISHCQVSWCAAAFSWAHRRNPTPFVSPVVLLNSMYHLIGLMSASPPRASNGLSLSIYQRRFCSPSFWSKHFLKRHSKEGLNWPLCVWHDSHNITSADNSNLSITMLTRTSSHGGHFHARCVCGPWAIDSHRNHFHWPTRAINIAQLIDIVVLLDGAQMLRNVKCCGLINGESALMIEMAPILV